MVCLLWVHRPLRRVANPPAACPSPPTHSGFPRPPAISGVPMGRGGCRPDVHSATHSPGKPLPPLVRTRECHPAANTSAKASPTLLSSRMETIPHIEASPLQRTSSEVLRTDAVDQLHCFSTEHGRAGNCSAAGSTLQLCGRRSPPAIHRFHSWLATHRHPPEFAVCQPVMRIGDAGRGRRIGGGCTKAVSRPAGASSSLGGPLSDKEKARANPMIRNRRRHCGCGHNSDSRH